MRTAVSSASTIPCKSALSRSTLPGLRYTFNPYVGCQHGCLYCYVPDVLKSREMAQGWGRKIYVKEGILKLLKGDLRKNLPGVVGVSTVTDPYQPIEKALEITRQAISILKKNRFPVSIQTKSSLITRDLDMIKSGMFDVGITITSLDEEFCKLFEPGASTPEERAQVLEEVSSKGINTWIFYGPVIPNFNDSSVNIEGIIRLAERTKSKIMYDKLNIRPLMIKRIARILSPDQIESIKRYNFNKVFAKLEELCINRGVPCQSAF